MSLLISLRSEILKIKRTTSVYLGILVAAIVPIVLFVEHLDQDMIAEAIPPANIWSAHFNKGLMAINFLVLPMFIILLATLLPQIEYRNNTWKQIFASPQSLPNIFLSRFIIFQCIILLCLLGFNLLMGLSAWAIEGIAPGNDFSGTRPEWSELLRLNVATYFCALAMSTLQFWLGLRFKNFIVPIAIGLLLYILGGVLLLELHLPHADKFPYIFSTLVMIPDYKADLPLFSLYSVGYAAVFLALAYRDIRLKKVGLA